MKIKVRLEIGISMFNCAAVKKWKRSVAWNNFHWPEMDSRCSLQTQHVQQPSTICAWCSTGALIAGQALCETVKWL